MLELKHITVRFGETTAVDDVSFTVGPDERVAILGPSGSGKSTLMRAVAGLEQLASGEVIWNGSSVAGVPPHLRQFGFMFQGYALFPHLTVGENVGFGLKMEGIPAEAAAERVDEVLTWVGMEGLKDRTVDRLSGGEQQRVALARTFAPRPRLVMLDEPLGALDRNLRERLVLDVRDLLERTGVPALYVTHDHDEAATVADRVAILRAGRLVQIDTMDRIRTDPVDEWVHTFVS